MYMRILLVDDSHFILKHAENILKKSELPVEIFDCTSGKEALEILGKEEIDIVLLDIIMPEMGGIEILREMKSNDRFSNSDVLMFSSLSDKETLHTCFEMGANDYITKPIDELEFLARIKSAVRKKSLEKSTRKYMLEIEKRNEELIAVNTKLKQAQNQLLQQEKMASVGHLAAGVAHEINNPLGFITSNVTTLRKYTDKYKRLSEIALKVFKTKNLKTIDGIAEKYLNELGEYVLKTDFDFINEDLDGLYNDTAEGLERVGKIVRGLRNFSHIDQLEEKGIYDVNEGIENTLIITRNEMKYSAELQLNLGTLPEIAANGGQINQVFLNMLLNAVAAVKEKHETDIGLIEITTEASEKNVMIHIKDNGNGIPEEYLNTIFDPFFTTKPVGEGTGLGLSISYDIIVNKHNGWIDVRSVVGEGTEFIITLPIENTISDADN